MFKFVLIALLLAASSVVMAENDSDSCGLGWQVTQKKTFSATTTRGTTNVVVPPTFGMSSGTIGCTQHSLVKADMKSLHYADANYENLMAEMAEGQGEYLTGFAASMGCAADAEFSSAMQSHYSTLSSGSSAAELVKNVKFIIQNSSLKNHCQA